MKWYEFQIGFYVEAENEVDAMHEAGRVLDVANDVDAEGDAQIENIAEWPQGGPQLYDWNKEKQT